MLSPRRRPADGGLLGPRDLLAEGAVSDRKSEFEFVFQTLGHLQRVHSKALLDITNVETIFSAFDVARTLRKLPGVAEDRIDHALTALQWVIVRTLEQSFKFPTRGPHIIGTHDYARLAELIQGVQSRQPPLSPAIITFNYDIGVDVALDDAGASFTYGLQDGGGGVPLLKLHGSLNWGRRGTDGEVVAWKMRDYRSEYMLRYTMPGDEAKDIYVPISQHMAKKYGAEFEELPVIVPPTWSKGEHQRQLWRVWQRAARELAGAAHIVVIGYSLPETDIFFRLLYGLGAEGDVPLQSFLLFDPNSEVHQRFREMLGPAAAQRFRPSGMNFKNALGELRTTFRATERR